MKKIILLIIVLLLFTGCSLTQKKENDNEKKYFGKTTELSKKYLSKGYLVNVYRSSISLGDDAKNYGKGYITMTFNVIIEFVSTIDYNDTNKYIKEKVISNIRIIKTPKMGIAEDIYPNYDAYGTNTELKGSKNSYAKKYDTPIFSPEQTSIAVALNHIALFDSSNYGWDEQPTTSQIYNDLDITRDNVALTLGFRIELITVDGKILYKDYEIEMPPKGFDIGGSEFQMNFMTDDISQMDAFYEKE